MPTARLAIHLFGPPRAAVDGRPLPASGRREVDRLLALLLVEPAAAPRWALAARLWPGESRAGALRRLRQALHYLNGYLPSADASWVDARDGSLRWRSDADAWCDLHAFRSGAAPLLEALRVGAPLELQAVEALAALAAAPLLEGLDDDWAIAERERVGRQLADLRERLGEQRLVLGDPHGALGEALAVLDLDPARETAWRLAIRSRLAQGDRGQAAALLAACTEQLQAHLGVTPEPETRALCSAGPEPAVPTDAPLAPQPDGILPPLPAVLMANPAARHLAARLEVERLIGVVGPPGAGKTWLALETAHALAAREWPVWWLSARSASSPVVGAGALVSRVRGTPAILFLDGVDADRHAVEAAVLRLLQAHPGLRVVLVGRRPPAVYGASVHGVPDRASPDAVGAIPKGTEALFAHALAWHRPAGGANALAPPDVRTVLEIADGLALAVVRAAAHCASRPAAELVGNAEGVLDRLDGAHLDRRFEAALLSSALEDGHAGLSPPERAVLRRLATFPGAFDRSAAAHVCGGVGTDVAPEAVPEILARLVDGLLVVRAASVAGASRFRLVRPVRWHARRKLAEAGEARAAARRWLEASAGNPAG